MRRALGLLLAGLLVFAAGPARAEPSPVPPSDAAAAPAPDGGAPGILPDAAPPASAEPPPDLAAAAGLAPTLTPAPPQGLPPLTLDQSPPAPARVPYYRKDWFWGAVGLVVATAVIILISAQSSGPGTPTTTLGDMRAF